MLKKVIEKFGNVKKNIYLCTVNVVVAKCV